MPNITISLSVAQANRLEQALRKRYDADRARTLAELVRRWVTDRARAFVLESEGLEAETLARAVTPLVEEF